MKYAEIINGNLYQIHPNLPTTYNNISNFFALEKELLEDLTWSGNEGVCFYECYEIENNTELAPNTRLSDPIYNIDYENKKVIVTYVVEEIEPEQKSPEPVPQMITATQIRLWLVRNNISLESIDNAINSIEDTKIREETKVQWEYAPYIERNHPFINTIGNQLGLGPVQINDAFIEASKY